MHEISTKYIYKLVLVVKYSFLPNETAKPYTGSFMDIGWQTTSPESCLSSLSYLLLAYKVQKIFGVHRARVMMLILGLIFL